MLQYVNFTNGATDLTRIQRPRGKSVAPSYRQNIARSPSKSSRDPPVDAAHTLGNHAFGTCFNHSTPRFIKIKNRSEY